MSCLEARKDPFISDFLVMSSTLDDHSPPSYEEITAPQVWSIPLGPSYCQERNYNSLPPNYINSNIPSLNAPLPASQNDVLATVDDWSIETPRPIYSNPSAFHTTTVCNQHCNTETPEATYYNISTPPMRADGNNFPNLENNITQRTSVIAKRFQIGRPKVLGIMMILAALAQFAVGVALVFKQFDSGSRSLSYGIPFWTSAFYIITESLFLAAKAKAPSCLVKTIICCNIITWIFCATAIAFSVLDLEEIKCSHPFCQTYADAIPLYYSLIALNILILLLSLLTALVGVYALRSHSKEDPQRKPTTRNVRRGDGRKVLISHMASAPPIEVAHQRV
ncbi:membrane-spanning 4-domains subfamily A member 4A-like [Ranitomeya imitator]|uniref:membrane-spanning 4-domains subfamily A member 4A-like n=1 Tax=Ranitomeya imitator TaxID=111125 RepID=UPI0037E7B951